MFESQLAGAQEVGVAGSEKKSGAKMFNFTIPILNCDYD